MLALVILNLLASWLSFWFGWYSQTMGKSSGLWTFVGLYNLFWAAYVFVFYVA